MPSKKQATKAEQQNVRPLGVYKDPPMPRWLKVALLVIVVIFLVWLLFLRGAERYSANTDEVKSRIQTTLEAAQLPGKQLASNVVDNGCDDRSSVGLQKRIGCSMEGYKYVEVSGNTKDALQLADAKIESLGFKKYSDQVNANQILSGGKEGDVDYSKDHAGVRLGWSTLPAGVNGPGSTAISEALSSHRISIPGNSGTVIGVVVNESYWTCSTGGIDIWGLICMFPPSNK